jgi:hypothetical protein
MAIYALANPIYQPAMRIVASITKGNPTVVTTTFNHLYNSETIVRLDIPPGYGMTQINQQFGPITVTGATTFTIPIDSTLYDPFVAPMSYPANAQQAQVVSFGELSDTLINAVQNTLPH